MDTALLWLNFSLNLAGVVAFGGLLMYSRRTRKTVNDARAEVGEARGEVAELRGRVDRFADNVSLLTTQVQELGSLVRHQAADTQRRFDDLANREQTAAIVKSEMLNLAFLLRNPSITVSADGRSAGTAFQAPTQVGAVAGGSIGTITPPRPSERPHTI